MNHKALLSKAIKKLPARYFSLDMRLTIFLYPKDQGIMLHAIGVNPPVATVIVASPDHPPSYFQDHTEEWREL